MKTSLSYSKVSSYLECPRKFKFYCDKIKVPKTRPLILGSVAHQVFEAYVNHCKKNKVTSDLTMMREIASKAFWDSKDRPHPNDLEEILELADLFANSHTIDLGCRTELRMAVDENGDPVEFFSDKVFFRGVADLVVRNINRIKIRDYKTGRSVEVDRFQPELYAWMLSKYDYEVDIEGYDIEMDFVRFKIVKPLTVTTNEVPTIESKVFNIADRIFKDSKLAPNPGIHCTNCDYVDMCEARPSELSSCKTESEAIQLARDIALIKAKLKSKDKSLKKFCSDNGNIKVDDTEFGYRKVVSSCIPDMKLFVNRLIAAGLDPWSYLRADIVKAKTLLNREDTNELWTDVIMDNSYTRFGTGAEDSTE